MKTVLIGSGNVAFHFAKAFSATQQRIDAIFGRNIENLKQISDETSVPFSKQLPDADFYILAVSDRAVTEVSKLITKENCLVAHTSGSLPMDALQGNFRKGVFYPLQTFSKNKIPDFSEIPFFINAKNTEDQEVMINFARQISKNVMPADDEKRKYIHLTAVFGNNFVNHLFARAKEIADSQGIPFDFFFPLIKETINKIYEIEPKDAQTGPAVRNDQTILQMQERLLDGQKLEIYKTISTSIKEMYGLE